MNSTENTECGLTGNMLPESDANPESDTTKRCRKCEVLKLLTEFEFRRDTNNYRSICKRCNYLHQLKWKRNNAAQVRKYHETDWSKNREARISKSSEYNHTHVEQMRIWRREYRWINRKEIAEKDKRYREINSEAIKKKQEEFYQKNKLEIFLKRKIRRNTNLQAKLKHKLRSRLGNALRARRVSKLHRTFDLIGCTPAFLTSYIRSKLHGGMTEQDLLNGKIHIDHIIPCAAFDLTNEEEQRKCFHYTNLQPLWAIDNLKKNAKIL
jgi:hypothetical protein